MTNLMSDKDDRTEEQVELLIGLVRGFRTVAKFLFPIPEHGLEKRLPRITAPTLVLWGRGDRFMSPSYADILRARIPDVQVEMLPEAGHLIGLEQPESYARALLRFGGEGSPMARDPRFH